DGKPYGPLPRSWGTYRGMYTAGDRVVFAYTVGDTKVLESPGVIETKAGTVFTRSFEIGPRETPMKLRELRHPPGTIGHKNGGIGGREHEYPLPAWNDSEGRFPTPIAGCAEAPTGCRFTQADDGYLLLEIPAGKGTRRFTIWVGSVPPRADEWP